MDEICSCGHLDLLKFAVGNGSAVDECMLAVAAGNSDKAMMQYLIPMTRKMQNFQKVAALISEFAARKGDMDFLTAVGLLTRRSSKHVALEDFPKEFEKFRLESEMAHFPDESNILPSFEELRDNAKRGARITEYSDPHFLNSHVKFLCRADLPIVEYLLSFSPKLEIQEFIFQCAFVENNIELLELVYSKLGDAVRSIDVLSEIISYSVCFSVKDTNSVNYNHVIRLKRRPRNWNLLGLIKWLTDHGQRLSEASREKLRRIRNSEFQSELDKIIAEMPRQQSNTIQSLSSAKEESCAIS